MQVIHFRCDGCSGAMQHAVQKNVCRQKNLPIPHPKHNCCNRTSIQCGNGAPSTQCTPFVNINLFQCLVPDESHHLVIGFPLFGDSCKHMAMLPILSIPFHYPWLRVKPVNMSNQTASGCGCKQNDGMSRRDDHNHHPAPFVLCSRSTTASRHISDHKNSGQ